ncbi:Alkaline phosphatase-like, alpha/beta/alpha [Artemisia annua]|uniref:Alkaline phosphatase-like, alpha/beta/alpha n=1 Tax=Artemisia annua TaxID=35608 RepID=A0A2U1LT86_ARTAN|nr:Alkaline phosphatase-like, alpha/beta/alpha [Artemisia annua]
MKALDIGEKTRDAVLSGKFDQVRVNIPNGDMVGHTGDVEATVRLWGTLCFRVCKLCDLSTTTGSEASPQWVIFALIMLLIQIPGYMKFEVLGVIDVVEEQLGTNLIYVT